MLSLLIIITFIIFGYVAYRRGLIYQGVMTITFVVSFLLAALLYRLFIPLVSLWVPYPSATAASKFVFFSQTLGLNLDKAFYAGIAFSVVLLLIWLLIGILLRGFAKLRYVDIGLQHNLSSILAIILGLIVAGALISLVLALLSMIPLEGVQRMIEHSFLAKFLTRATFPWSAFYTKLFIGII